MSLKELFAAVTAAAVFCACAAIVGFDNPMFWLSIVVMVAMSLVWIRSARKATSRWAAALTPLIFLFPCGLLLTSAATLSHGVLLVIAGAIVAYLPQQPKSSLVRVTALCLLASLVAGIATGHVDRARLLAERRQYPQLDLSARLAYERTRTQNGKVLLASNLGLTALDDLGRWEEEMDFYSFTGRRGQLERLHDQQLEKFIVASGFGVGRMAPFPRPGRIDRALLRDVAFTETESYGRDDWPGPWQPPRGDSIEASNLREFHEVGRADFLHPNGFGAVLEPRTKVAGFIPHAFHNPPTTALKDPPTWTLERLELVSLLKFTEPRVYVLDHLPRMDQLAGDDVPTRPLDEFESDALPRLRTAEDVVIDDAAQPTRMLGSLRAANQCRDCHSVQRGELLGAFTYFLHPSAAAKPLEPASPDP